MTKANKKSGRPRLAQRERKAQNITFRSRKDLYEQLRETAEKTGHSLSETIERHLERAFQASDPILASLTGEEGPAILRLITEILLKATRNQSLHDNRELVETVSSAASLIIARVAGLFDDDLSTDDSSADKIKLARQRGRELAQSTLRDAGLPY